MYLYLLVSALQHDEYNNSVYPCIREVDGDPMIFIGCSGWFYNHWRGRFYPAEMPRLDWYHYYAKHFKTVEINATFYRFPTENLILGWKKKASPGFRFFIKGNRTITHLQRLKGSDKLVNEFSARASLLKKNLAGILWQFPPSLKRDDELLADFCKKLKRVPHVIEFRHKSWFDEEVYRILRKHRIGFCAVSAPNFPRDVVVTSKQAYIRFHGHKSWYKTNYTDADLRSWAAVIGKLRAKEVYCYFNNDFQAFAVQNALRLKELLAGRQLI